MTKNVKTVLPWRTIPFLTGQSTENQLLIVGTIPFPPKVVF
jgi:hypothetical protein